MIAVRDGRDPNMIDDIRVQWADAATRSVAQEADAVVKLYQAGLLPASYALAQARLLRRRDPQDRALGRIGQVKPISSTSIADSGVARPIRVRGG